MKEDVVVSQPEIEEAINELVGELEGEGDDGDDEEGEEEESSSEEVFHDEGVDEDIEAEDRDVKISMERSREAGTPVARIPALICGPTNLQRFEHKDVWIAHLAMNKKLVHSERPVDPEALSNAEFRARCKGFEIQKLVMLNEYGSWELTREIYANVVRRVATWGDMAITV